MRLGQVPCEAGVASRRASEEIIRAGRVTVGGEPVHRSGARRGPDDDVARRRQAGRPTACPSGWCTRSTSRPASSRPRATPRAGGPSSSLVPQTAAAVPGRAARRRHHRADPADQRRRARAPAHPSELRGREDLPRGGRRARRSRSARAARAAARGSSSRTGTTAPARVRRVAADTLELTIHEGRKRQVKRMCEAVGHPVKRSSGSASARSSWATCRADGGAS